MPRGFFALPVLALLLPLFAHAALLPDYGTLELDLSPQYPAPGQTVTLTVVNTAPDAKSAVYTWTVDGKTVARAAGQQQITVAAGSTGASEEVTVTTEDAAGNETGAASITLNPASVDVIWEGDTAGPPLYIGRPLPNGQSPVTVLAVPHIAVDGKEVAPSALIYTWSVDTTPLANQSGYGRSSVSVTPPRFGAAFTVKVHAETADGRGAGDGSATIAPQTPRALMYENAPLLGILFNKNVSGTYPLSEPEASFTAYPLYTANPGALTYKWTLDDSAFDVDAAHPLDVTFRKVGAGSGSHAVRFSFTNPGRFMEAGSASFSLSF
jgi:hypothetical protein